MSHTSAFLKNRCKTKLYYVCFSKDKVKLDNITEMCVISKIKGYRM